MTMASTIHFHENQSKLNFMLQGDVFHACRQYGFYWRKEGNDVIIFAEKFADEVDQLYISDVDREVYKLKGPYTSLCQHSLIILYRNGTEKKIGYKVDNMGFVDFYEEPICSYKM